MTEEKQDKTERGQEHPDFHSLIRDGMKPSTEDKNQLKKEREDSPSDSDHDGV